MAARQALYYESLSSASSTLSLEADSASTQKLTFSYTAGGGEGKEDWLLILTGETATGDSDAVPVLVLEVGYDELPTGDGSLNEVIVGGGLKDTTNWRSLCTVTRLNLNQGETANVRVGFASLVSTGETVYARNVRALLIRLDMGSDHDWMSYPDETDDTPSSTYTTVWQRDDAYLSAGQYLIVSTGVVVAAGDGDTRAAARLLMDGVVIGEMDLLYLRQDVELAMSPFLVCTKVTLNSYDAHDFTLQLKKSSGNSVWSQYFSIAALRLDGFDHSIIDELSSPIVGSIGTSYTNVLADNPSLFEGDYAAFFTAQHYSASTSQDHLIQARVGGSVVAQANMEGWISSSPYDRVGFAGLWYSQARSPGNVTFDIRHSLEAPVTGGTAKALIAILGLDVVAPAVVEAVGTLAAGSASMGGISEILRTGIGNLAAGPASMGGNSEILRTGAGNLASMGGTLAGIGALIRTGAGPLTGGGARSAGIATAHGNRVGAGVLTGVGARVSAVFAGPPTGTGALTAGAGVLAGTGAITRNSSGALSTTAPAAMFGTGGVTRNGSGALNTSAPAALSGSVAVTRTGAAHLRGGQAGAAGAGEIGRTGIGALEAAGAGRTVALVALGRTIILKDTASILDDIGLVREFLRTISDTLQVTDDHVRRWLSAALVDPEVEMIQLRSPAGAVAVQVREIKARVEE